MPQRATAILSPRSGEIRHLPVGHRHPPFPARQPHHPTVGQHIGKTINAVRHPRASVDARAAARAPAGHLPCRPPRVWFAFVTARVRQTSRADTPMSRRHRSPRRRAWVAAPAPNSGAIDWPPFQFATVRRVNNPPHRFEQETIQVGNALSLLGLRGHCDEHRGAYWLRNVQSMAIQTPGACAWN